MSLKSEFNVLRDIKYMLLCSVRKPYYLPAAFGNFVKTHRVGRCVVCNRVRVLYEEYIPYSKYTAFYCSPCAEIASQDVAHAWAEYYSGLL